jgi:hypothetical protein
MFRRSLQLSFIALAALSPFSARAAVEQALAEVVVVHPTRIADIVVLGHGFDASLRQGMICRITRGGSQIAEVILVELRSTCGSALIVNLSPRQSIQVGDVASVKILKS